LGEVKAAGALPLSHLDPMPVSTKVAGTAKKRKT
jgi:hypothetical protein